MAKLILSAFLIAFTTLQFPSDLSSLLNGGKQPSDPAGPPAISTTFADAYQQVPALDDFNPVDSRPLEELPRTSDGAFVLRPGTYASSLETFCLDVGAHAPDTDAAYVIAPLKGPQSAEIQSLVTRAYAQPDIPQSMVQMLVWSVTSHVNLSNLSASLQQNVQRMMSAREQANVNSASAPAGAPAFLNAILAMMPPEAVASLRALLSSRSALSSGSDSYEQVAGGLSTPAHADNAGVPRARWAYLAPGYFVRFQSTTYQASELQVYVPEGWTVGRDASHRLASLQSTQGSSLTLTYGSGGTTVQVNQPLGVVPGAFRQGQATVNFAGTDPDDAKALQALGAAIASSPAQSPAWSGLRDAAADDAAKARAELVCRTMACDVGKGGTPPPAFSTASVIASPSDRSLQPLAIAARPVGTPVGEPPTDRCVPPHAGTVKDPIPMECLVDLPKRPTDCDLVANQIRAGELAQGAYANAGNVEKWSKLTISQYAQQSRWAAEDAAAAGMPTVKSGSPSSGGGDNGDKIGRLGDTDMDTCTASMSADAAGLTPIERQAIKAHEAEHVVTCNAWKAARARGAKPDPETPRSRAEDEVRAYDAGLAALRKWYAAHCGANQ